MLMHDRDPIFLQALWRSCSTYFWTKFRENPDLRCYKEPLHEGVLTFSETNLASDPNERASLRHPVLKEHYFAEYEIAEGGGVPGFRKRFAELTGADIDLSDFKRRKPGEGRHLTVSDEAKAIIRRAAEKLNPDWARLETLGMAESTKKFLDLIVS